MKNFSVNRFKKLFFLTIIISLSHLLISCHTRHATYETSVQEINTTLQESIDGNIALMHPHRSEEHYYYHHTPKGLKNALLPPLSHYVHTTRHHKLRFDVTANKVPARDFFLGLVQGTSYNVIMDPNIDGVITLTLRNVTLEQALDAVSDIYGYEYRHTSYGFEVLPPHLQTQLFHINYLDVQRTGKSFIQLTTGEVVNTGSIGSGTGGLGFAQPQSNQPSPESSGTISSIETKSEVRFWKDIEKSIVDMIGGLQGGRSVSVNGHGGVISVRAYPGELHQVTRYVNSLQSSLNRQVILEAKILEVNLDDQFQAGIDWSVLANPAKLDPQGNPILDPVTGLPVHEAGMGQAGTNVFPSTDLQYLEGIFAIRVNGNFKLLIKLLQTQGNVQILSSPHISTVNNQKAVIKVGQDEFFVTGVSTSNTIVGTNTLPSQNVILTPFFSGITLDVTPEIGSDNNIVLHIHPSISKVTEQTKVVGLGANTNGTQNNLTLPLAKSTIRESDNIVRAKSGQVVVIGGLMQNNMSEVIAATPWLSKIPFLGSIFRRTEQIANKSELVILLRPVVLNNKRIIQKLRNEKRQFEIVQRPFHFGGLPKVFGNEGETADNE